MPKPPDPPKNMPKDICRGCVKQVRCETSSDYICARFRTCFYDAWSATVNFLKYLAGKDDEYD